MNPLPRSWVVAIYASLLVPFVGPMLLVLGSSLGYYWLRRTKPETARALNRHAWIAIALNVCANTAVLLLVRR